MNKIYATISKYTSQTKTIKNRRFTMRKLTNKNKNKLKVLGFTILVVALLIGLSIVGLPDVTWEQARSLMYTGLSLGLVSYTFSKLF